MARKPISLLLHEIPLFLRGGEPLCDALAQQSKDTMDPDHVERLLRAVVQVTLYAHELPSHSARSPVAKRVRRSLPASDGESSSDEDSDGDDDEGDGDARDRDQDSGRGLVGASLESEGRDDAVHGTFSCLSDVSFWDSRLSLLMPSFCVAGGSEASVTATSINPSLVPKSTQAAPQLPR